MCNVQYTLCIVQRAILMCNMQCAIYIVKRAIGRAHCAECHDMQSGRNLFKIAMCKRSMYTLCIVQCATCSVHYAVCNMQYATMCSVQCAKCATMCNMQYSQSGRDQTLQYSLAPNEVCSSLIKSILSTCLAFSQHFLTFITFSQLS